MIIKNTNQIRIMSRCYLLESVEWRPYEFFRENILDLNSESLVSAGYTMHQSCSRIMILQSIDTTADPVETRFQKGQLFPKSIRISSFYLARYRCADIDKNISIVHCNSFESIFFEKS